MPRPAVSILLPVRNGARTLERALYSIAAQTCAEWELLAVDDGSTDGTAALLDRWRRADARVRVLRQGADGIVAALERGLAAASGEYIARLDADDEAHPERLERQVAALQSDAGLGLVSCLVAFAGDGLGQAGYARYVAWLNSVVTAEEIALHRFVESPVAHPTVMFRRALVERFGGYRAGPFPEDYELWLRWLDAGVRMAKVPEVLLTWHDSPGRLSRIDPRYAPDAFFRAKAPYLARWLERRRLEEGRDRSVWIWGAGRPTRRRVDALRAEGVKVAGYIDIDPRKVGRMVDGVEVVRPEQLPPPDNRFVLAYVSKVGARELIARYLTGIGYELGRDYLLCA